ncbi:hypothetical protein CJ483_04830 [Bacillus sp. PK3_68]|nr:hypothetical protein CJ483_04830 [Bacillus sp. PK3_68]
MFSMMEGPFHEIGTFYFFKKGGKTNLFFKKDILMTTPTFLFHRIKTTAVIISFLCSPENLVIFSLFTIFINDLLLE